MKTITATILAAVLPIAAIPPTGKICLRDAQNQAVLYVDTRAETWTFCQPGRPDWRGTGLTVTASGVRLTINHERADVPQSFGSDIDLFERTHKTILNPPNSGSYTFYGETHPVTSEEDCTCKQ